MKTQKFQLRLVGMQFVFAFASLAATVLCYSTSAFADKKLILVQKVELTVVDGKATWVGVGNGPFKDRFPNGIDATGTIKMQEKDKPAPKAGLTQSRMLPANVVKTEFGSIAAAKGSIIVNNTGAKVTEIEITTKGTTGGTPNTIDDKSGDGDDFDWKIDKLTMKTITFKAKKGKELAPDQNIWMLIPEGPQPGMPGAKIYEGKVTTNPPVAPPAPAPAAPSPPAASSGGGSGLSYDSSMGVLSFQPSTVVVIAYSDGSSTVTNSADEDVIGSQIQIGQMQVLGPSSTVPGAYALSDSGIAFVQGEQVLLQAELTNNLLIPDPQHPGYAILQGSLTVGEEGLPLVWGGQDDGLIQSKYIEEYFGASGASDVFLETNILATTQNLTEDGEATGTAMVASVAPFSMDSSFVRDDSATDRDQGGANCSSRYVGVWAGVYINRQVAFAEAVKEGTQKCLQRYSCGFNIRSLICQQALGGWICRGAGAGIVTPPSYEGYLAQCQ